MTDEELRAIREYARARAAEAPPLTEEQKQIIRTAWRPVRAYPSI